PARRLHGVASQSPRTFHLKGPLWPSPVTLLLTAVPRYRLFWHANCADPCTIRSRTCGLVADKPRAHDLDFLRITRCRASLAGEGTSAGHEFTPRRISINNTIGTSHRKIAVTVHVWHVSSSSQRVRHGQQTHYGSQKAKALHDSDPQS